MRQKMPASVALAVGLAACVSAPPSARSPLPANGPVLQAAIESAAIQVSRCYRAPRVASAGREIVTRLRVRLSPDGSLSGLPIVMSQSGVGPHNQAYAARMAEAAIESVLRCAPLRLPTEAHRGLALDIELTFSPLASA